MVFVLFLHLLGVVFCLLLGKGESKIVLWLRLFPWPCSIIIRTPAQGFLLIFTDQKLRTLPARSQDVFLRLVFLFLFDLVCCR